MNYFYKKTKNHYINYLWSSLPFARVYCKTTFSVLLQMLWKKIPTLIGQFGPKMSSSPHFWFMNFLFPVTYRFSKFKPGKTKKYDVFYKQFEAGAFFIKSLKIVFKFGSDLLSQALKVENFISTQGSSIIMLESKIETFFNTSWFNVDTWTFLIHRCYIWQMIRFKYYAWNVGIANWFIDWISIAMFERH